jgi:cell division protein ZapA
VKQVEVTILGQSYLLACPDGAQSQLASAVASVDREMAAIRDAGKVKARERIAVLAALNIAFDRPPTAISGPTSATDSSKASSQAPSATSPNASADASSHVSSTDQAVIAGLIARIDEALGEDGRLI